MRILPKDFEPAPSLYLPVLNIHSHHLLWQLNIMYRFLKKLPGNSCWQFTRLRWCIMILHSILLFQSCAYTHAHFFCFQTRDPGRQHGNDVVFGGARVSKSHSWLWDGDVGVGNGRPHEVLYWFTCEFYVMTSVCLPQTLSVTKRLMLTFSWTLRNCKWYVLNLNE